MGQGRGHSSIQHRSSRSKTVNRAVVIGVVVAMSVPVLVGTAHAGPTVVVDTTLDAAAAPAETTLREAMDAVNGAGDGEIVLQSGKTYNLDLGCDPSDDTNAGGDLDFLGTGLTTIRTSGAGRASINALTCATERVLDHRGTGTLVLDNLTIKGGRAPAGEHGGGIRVLSGSLEVRDSVVTANRAGNGVMTIDHGTDGGHGGGIYFSGGTLDVDHSTISSNRAGDGGDGTEGLDGESGVQGSGGVIGTGGGNGGASASCVFGPGNPGNGGANGENCLSSNGGAGAPGGPAGQFPFGGSPGTPGGDANNGGDGGDGGSGGGIYVASGTVVITASSIFSNTAGRAGDGGLAGWGGDGGKGGDGGGGGHGGHGGGSGDATAQHGQFNMMGRGGKGGDAFAGSGGTGGDGGPGGEAGDGGDGGDGGTGGDGGDGGHGGGIYNAAATLTISDSTVSRNHAGDGGLGRHGGKGGKGGQGGTGGVGGQGGNGGDGGEARGGNGGGGNPDGPGPGGHAHGGNGGIAGKSGTNGRPGDGGAGGNAANGGNGGAGGSGGGIASSGTTTIERSTVTDNDGGLGRLGGSFRFGAPGGAVGKYPTLLSGGLPGFLGGAIPGGGAPPGTIQPSAPGFTWSPPKKTVFSLLRGVDGNDSIDGTDGSSGNGGNVARTGGSLSINRSAVVLPAAGTNCSGTAPGTSSGYSADSDGTCGFTDATDLPGQSAAALALGPLATNDGGTKNHLPGAGSVLIDAIPSGSCTGTSDQRDIARPQGPDCDIGAVEVEPVE